MSRLCRLGCAVMAFGCLSNLWAATSAPLDDTVVRVLLAGDVRFLPDGVDPCKVGTGGSDAEKALFRYTACKSATTGRMSYASAYSCCSVDHVCESYRGCGKSCDGIQDEVERIGLEIQANPETAFDHEEELRKLGNELQEMGC